MSGRTLNFSSMVSTVSTIHTVRPSTNRVISSARTAAIQSGLKIVDLSELGAEGWRCLKELIKCDIVTLSRPPLSRVGVAALLERRILETPPEGSDQPPKVVCPHWMFEPQPRELQVVLLDIVSGPYCGVGLFLSFNDSSHPPPLVANSRWCCLWFCRGCLW